MPARERFQNPGMAVRSIVLSRAASANASRASSSRSLRARRIPRAAEERVSCRDAVAMSSRPATGRFRNCECRRQRNLVSVLSAGKVVSPMFEFPEGVQIGIDLGGTGTQPGGSGQDCGARALRRNVPERRQILSAVSRIQLNQLIASCSISRIARSVTSIVAPCPAGKADRRGDVRRGFQPARAKLLERCSPPARGAREKVLATRR